jgi:hypothetical protein
MPRSPGGCLLELCFVRAAAHYALDDAAAAAEAHAEVQTIAQMRPDDWGVHMLLAELDDSREAARR